MSPDRRPCPVCKKAPPRGQEWRDYGAHVKACAAAFYEGDREKRTAESLGAFGDLLRTFMKGPV